MSETRKTFSIVCHAKEVKLRIGFGHAKLSDVYMHDGNTLSALAQFLVTYQDYSFDIICDQGDESVEHYTEFDTR